MWREAVRSRASPVRLHTDRGRPRPPKRQTVKDRCLIFLRDDALPLALCVNVLGMGGGSARRMSRATSDPAPERGCPSLRSLVIPIGPNDYWRWTEYAARKMLSDSGFESIEVAPIMPTLSIQSFMLALSARKAVPILGPVIAAGLDLIALGGLRSSNVRLTGGYVLGGRSRHRRTDRSAWVGLRRTCRRVPINQVTRRAPVG